MSYTHPDISRFPRTVGVLSEVGASRKTGKKYRKDHISQRTYRTPFVRSFFFYSPYSRYNPYHPQEYRIRFSHHQNANRWNQKPFLARQKRAMSVLYSSRFLSTIHHPPSTMENVATHQRRCALIHCRDTTPNERKKNIEVAAPAAHNKYNTRRHLGCMIYMCWSSF